MLREVTERECGDVNGGTAPRFETDEDGSVWMVTCTGDRIRMW